MAHHKSSLKRIRSDRKKAARNRYYHKTARNAVRTLRATTDAKKAAEMLESSTVAVLLAQIEKTGEVLAKSKATYFFGVEPGRMEGMLANPNMIGKT